MSDCHDELVARLQYFDDPSDTLGLFADGSFLRLAAVAVAEPFRGAGIAKVAGIEARGFVLAACVAVELDAASAGECLVVDDWAETGSKALTARRLIDACGGEYAGLSLLVDQLPGGVRDRLHPVASVALAEELRPA